MNIGNVTKSTTAVVAGVKREQYIGTQNLRSHQGDRRKCLHRPTCECAPQHPLGNQQPIRQSATDDLLLAGGPASYLWKVNKINPRCETCEVVGDMEDIKCQTCSWNLPIWQKRIEKVEACVVKKSEVPPPERAGQGWHEGGADKVLAYCHAHPL